MALEAFKVAEYKGPKDRKSVALSASEFLVFEPQDFIEGAACTVEQDVIEDVFAEVEDDVEVPDVVLTPGANGKMVKTVVGKKLVRQVIGKKKIGENVTGKKNVGRRVAIVRGEDNLDAYARIVKDSIGTGENFYGYAEDLENELKKREFDDVIRPMIEQVLREYGLIDPEPRKTKAKK